MDHVDFCDVLFCYAACNVLSCWFKHCENTFVEISIFTNNFKHIKQQTENRAINSSDQMVT